MAHQRLFGTDGIRGRFGKEPVSPATILKLGWAIGAALNEQYCRGEVLIGKDTRVSGYALESALTCGLSCASIDIGLLGPVPTPAVSYFCRTTDAIAGIVISASHNPFHDNGIKLFGPDGRKVGEAFERRIEQIMQSPMHTCSSEQLGKARRFDECDDKYAEYCRSTISSRLDGLRIALDCANGASYRIAPRVLCSLGAEVSAVAVEPDGFNINRECGSTNLDNVCRHTIETASDVGVALDGDGDRVLLSDNKGNPVNGDQILYILASYRKREGMLKGGVVGTHLTNLGLSVALSDQSIPFARVEVGDRYVSSYMRQHGWGLGGEESGHILLDEQGNSGDGLLTALEVLAEMKRTGKSLLELADKVNLVPQVTRNVKLLDRSSPLTVMRESDWPSASKAVASAQKELSESGRVLLRPSGTEPLIRIFVEGSDRRQIKRIADQLADVVKAESSKITCA